MKITVTEKDKIKQNYPCLMESTTSGLIVLATSGNNDACDYPCFAGLAIEADSDITRNMYSKTWSTKSFKRSNKIVTLEND